ncbi:MAG TPA: Asp-tRNA(Asn)/Glu-tRNA(Gln) amidotransferase subunit GatB [Planctomycetota bacterium]|nr:Asp-tRNA(Asn)/Glu-tRNA(Gln) amidotransferase subunit GatB [Planctomycetota bacterium]
MSPAASPSPSSSRTRYEPVIGLEVHVQLATASKLFCRCEARFGAPPNTLICPVCSGQPGVLPVLNRAAFRLGVTAGLALGCRIDPVTKFDRKNYFYPDLPKGYQISQFDQPLCREGRLELELPDGRGGSAARRISIQRAHLEEDSGKIIHPEGLDLSLVDLNRAGVPLMEIVSGPDLRSPEEASLYLQALRRLLRYAGVSECDMEKGSFRCDANVSLRPAGSTMLGTRTEIKNLNSFRFVMQALQAEIDRQGAVLDRGGKVVQETMAFDPDSGRTAPMRSKEEAHDYRYFPEPDLPRFDVDAVLAPESIESLRAALPELPDQRAQRFTKKLHLSPQDAATLIEELPLADFFEKSLLAAGDAPAPMVSGIILTDALRLCNERSVTIQGLATPSQSFGELAQLVHHGQLSRQAASKVAQELEATRTTSARAMAEKLNLLQLSDEGELQVLVTRVLAEQSELVERYRAGKIGVFNALLGAVMKASGGRGNPATVRELLERQLGGG